MSRYCSQCGKAHKVCICDAIIPLNTDIELIILQHPTEASRPMGTARILSLCMPETTRCFVGEDFREHTELNALLSEPNVSHYVLYPSDASIEVTQIAQRPTQTIRIILLDGTWKKAFKMWQINTQLHHFASLHLPKDLAGNYRIRKAPDSNALSTVEAGFHVLRVLRPQQNFTPLLTAFDHMIDTQIQHMPPGTFERNYRQ